MGKGKVQFEVAAKQSSSVSVAQTREALEQAGFSCNAPEKYGRASAKIRTSRRKDVSRAKEMFGEAAAVSRGGRQVRFFGSHIETRAPVFFDLPVSGMMTENALIALRDKTGIDLLPSENVPEKLSRQARQQDVIFPEENPRRRAMPR